MKEDLMEDFVDVQDIKKQKEEYKRTNEEMAKWEFGKGLIQEDRDERNVRN